MLSSQKAKRVLLVLLAALASVVAVLLCAAAVFAWQEMTHEGLTSSQWYQGAIESFSLAWLYAVLAVQAAVMLWYGAARTAAKKPRGPGARPAVLWVLCWVLTALTALLGVFALQRWHALAQAAGSEYACGAAAAFGRARNGWVLAADVCALVWLKWLRRRARAEKRKENRMESETKMTILRGNAVLHTARDTIFGWYGPVSQDLDLVFRSAFVLEHRDWNEGIRDCVYRIEDREFTDLSFARGKTLRLCANGDELRLHEDGTRFLFSFSRIPTFDSFDRRWDGVSYLVAYRGKGGVHLLRCRHGEDIPRIEAYLGLIKSVPAFDEWLKDLEEE